MFEQVEDALESLFCDSYARIDNHKPDIGFLGDGFAETMVFNFFIFIIVPLLRLILADLEFYPAFLGELLSI